MDTTRHWGDRTRPTRAALWLGVALVVGACSSSGGGATAASGGNGTPAPAATQGVQPTDAAQATPATGGGGGGSAAGLCDFVTAAEMASALGTGALTTKTDDGPPPGCAYELGDKPVAAMVLTASGGEGAYDAMAGDAASVAVPGIGDKAILNEPAHELLILKGGKLLVVVLTPENASLPAATADMYKQIATIAAGRL